LPPISGLAIEYRQFLYWGGLRRHVLIEERDGNVAAKAIAADGAMVFVFAGFVAVVFALVALFTSSDNMVLAIETLAGALINVCLGGLVLLFALASSFGHTFDPDKR
jgi:hypothetical protein